MRILIVGIIVLALAVAGVSTYLIRTFGGEENVAEMQKKAEIPEIRVLVADRALNPGDPLAAGSMRWQRWVEESLSPQFISITKDQDGSKKIQELAGSIVRLPILAGEPILAAKVFKRDKAGMLAGVLDKGMRAVTFAVTPDTASAGFILPNDRVDVLLTHGRAREALQKKVKPGPPDPNEPLIVLQQTTETILEDVRVIAINQVLGPPAEGAVAVPTTLITLEVTPKQAELLITARAMGRLSLVLRSMQAGEKDATRQAFTTDVEVSPFLSNIDEILAAERRKHRLAIAAKSKPTTGAKAAKVEAAAPQQPMTTVSPEPKATVKIYRGGKGVLSEIKPK